MTEKKPTLGYAGPPPGRSLFGVLALMMTAISVGWVGYVRLEAAYERHPLLLPPSWETMFRYAWIPGAVALAFAVLGIILDRKRVGSFIAIATLALAYGWWALPIFFD